MSSQDTTRVLECTHAFHRDCIQLWCQSSVKAAPDCPICRAPVDPGKLPSSDACVVRIHSVHHHQVFLPRFGIAFDLLLIGHAVVTIFNFLVVLLAMKQVDSNEVKWYLLGVSMAHLAMLSSACCCLRTICGPRSPERDTRATLVYIAMIPGFPIQLALVSWLYAHLQGNPTRRLMFILETIALVVLFLHYLYGVCIWARGRRPVEVVRVTQE